MDFLMAAAGPYAQAAAMAQAQVYLAALQGQSQAGAPPPPPPGMMAGTPMLGAQFLTTSTAMPMPPAPPQISQAKRGSPNRDREYYDRERIRDHRRRRDRSRERSPERPERPRDRDRSRDRDRGRDRRDRSRERWRDRSRERGRSPRRDRERRERTPSSDEEQMNAPPNTTIMIRGMAQHLGELDIRDELTKIGLLAKDIRLIRRKETGASRGFAFVEFDQLQDAKKWMDERKGVLYFRENSRAIMQYSVAKSEKGRDAQKVANDWNCPKCGIQNFRRREVCFKCGVSKPEDRDQSEEDESSSTPSCSEWERSIHGRSMSHLNAITFSAVLLRGLDPLTTEDTVLNALNKLNSRPIKALRIGRDSATNVSNGVCYIDLNSQMDAVGLHNQLLGQPPVIDEKLISVSYQKMKALTPTQVANTAMAAAQWSHQKKYAEAEVESLSEYSASLYAKTPEEKAYYLEYYRNYYRNGGDSSTADPASSQHHPFDPSAPAPQKSLPNLGMVKVKGTEYKIYPTPDVNTFAYDEGSGYYFDSQTKFYYDATTRYYYNSTPGVYVYWSAEHKTYLPVQPDASKTEAPSNELPIEDGNIQKPKEKKEKVKSAKKIAKDMEKWAKTLNQKKEAAKISMELNTPPVPTGKPQAALVSKGPSSVGASDVAFSILRGGVVAPSSTQLSGASLSSMSGYVSEPEDEPVAAADGASSAVPEPNFTDWDGLACLLCKRQFASKDKLEK
eukprot:snap_masked-scaffold217_size252476-processed-gene-1.22 protein:Tk00467 transcript:snap_masked-scaffold217_size252476-processed-gene-1.22-mRNA-1 annotation:"rna-binding protein 5-like"